ncbi:glycosyltransferase family 4 protein [Pseudomonas sp. HMWF032]|uniref:glycosyltransferase family 4 protein n=1 Tax=Pseudomonas sp. HMWF032 TaxID=2056866 RepID=UPI001C47F452|nr:glycosyltransferase family 4 protein [Pseudomonas sp. HMWF032]
MTIQVLHVSREFEPLCSGVARHIQGLAQAIQANPAIRLTILAPLISADSSPANLCKGSYGQLWRAVGNSDVVHVHGARSPIAALAAACAIIRGVPLIYTPHCYYNAGPLWYRLAKRVWDTTVERVMVRGAATVILLHQGWEGELAKRGLCPKKTMIVPNCIDERRQATADAPIKLEGSPALLSVGRLDPIKRLDDAIAALNTPHLKQAVLHIVGQGSDRVRLEALAAQQKLTARVRFHGWQDDHVTQRMMAGCDSMLLASEREGMPTVVLEALLAGVPIACSDIEGCRSITDVVGWEAIFPVGNPNALAESVAHSASSNVSEAVIEAVREGFTWQRKAAALVRLYESLVSPSSQLGR